MEATTSNRSRVYRRCLLLTEWLKCEESGGWCVGVWGLPGCVSQGKDVTEAELMIVDCYKGFVASCEEEGDPVPWSATHRHWEGSEIRWVEYL